LYGLIGGIGISGGTGGAGAIAGVPVAALGGVVAAHGGLVLTGLVLKETFDPIPTIYFASAGSSDNNPRYPKPGETQGFAGRIEGPPPAGAKGIYEFRDKTRGNRWYVGGTPSGGDLLSRFRIHLRDERLASPDDFIWTEVPAGNESVGLPFGERIRIEQVAKEVGGRGNMANDPKTNPANLDAIRYWVEAGKVYSIPGWPDWLRLP
jgi:hypothetical protein